MDYKELLNSAAVEIRQGNTENAYKLLMDNKDVFVKDTTLYYFTISLACSLNKVEEALNNLREAVVTKDMWFNIDFLDRDQTLDVIREFDEFKEIYDICKQRQVNLRFSGEKQIDIYIPKTKTEKLFFMLPGNFQSVEEVKPTINGDVIKDYIVAIPQARELHSYQRYIWDDIDFGVKVVLEHYKELVEENSISEDNTIFSSFGAGAKIIYAAILDNLIPVKNILFFTPAISFKEDLEFQVKSLKERHTKIFIVCGENDSHYLPFSNQLDVLLTKYNVDHKLLLLKDTGHSFPKNAEKIINQAIQFFNEA